MVLRSFGPLTILALTSLSAALVPASLTERAATTCKTDVGAFLSLHCGLKKHLTDSL
jgi:hypothetical protein